MRQRVIGLGVGGHAKVVIEALQLCGVVDIVGLLDRDSARWGAEVSGIPVLGGDDLLPGLRAQGIEAVFIGLGGAGDLRPRHRLYTLARSLGFDVVAAVHPTAVVSRESAIGTGVTLLAGAIVNAGAQLGANVIINTGAIVEHDCVVADHVHVATGARLAGTVTIGEGSHIGLGACVRECRTIGRNVIVGAGAVVVDDVPDGVVVCGVPARVMSQRMLA